MKKMRTFSKLLFCLCCLIFGSDMQPAQALNVVRTSLTAIPGENDPLEYCDSTAYCFQQSQCEDTSCQNAIVLCHQVCESTFNAMLAAYSTPAVYLGSYTAGNIRNMLSTIECTKGDYIAYSESGGNIVLSPTSVAYSPGSSSATSGRYSIAFFQGVLRQYTPANSDEFKFYRVKETNGNISIGLKLTKGNTDVFYSDVSGMYP